MHLSLSHLLEKKKKKKKKMKKKKTKIMTKKKTKKMRGIPVQAPIEQIVPLVSILIFSVHTILSVGLAKTHHLTASALKTAAMP